jgi:hypothetical protein
MWEVKRSYLFSSNLMRCIEVVIVPKFPKHIQRFLNKYFDGVAGLPRCQNYQPLERCNGLADVNAHAILITVEE